LEDNVVKRWFDIAFSLSLLILTAPMLGVCAILIKLESCGPVFFVQWRMGKGFRPFLLYKLRTMETDASGLPFTTGTDPRVTRCGRWMRRMKLDELPQLVNVLLGEMSVVGPRPVVPEIALEFRAMYEQILRVQPGLTDPASLKYCREAELLALVPDPVAYFKTVVTPEKLRLSAEYIGRRSAWSDAALVVQTAVAVVDAATHPRLRLEPRRNWIWFAAPGGLPAVLREPGFNLAVSGAEAGAEGSAGGAASAVEG
jgi:lipopolysaccharide/colanic/teichoic acid biosynthesis glycosyltransferase